MLGWSHYRNPLAFWECGLSMLSLVQQAPQLSPEYREPLPVGQKQLCMGTVHRVASWVHTAYSRTMSGHIQTAAGLKERSERIIWFQTVVHSPKGKSN